MSGHIRKRKRQDGTVVYQARHTDPVRGGTHKIERTFAKKRDAEDWLSTQRASVLGGTYIAPSAGERPFSEVIEAWQESWWNRLSPTTARRYESIIDKYLLPEFGRTPIGRITHEVVQRYINRLASPPAAPG